MNLRCMLHVYYMDDWKCTIQATGRRSCEFVEGGHLLCLAVAYNVSLRRLVAQEFDCIFWFGTVEVAGGCDV